MANKPDLISLQGEWFAAKITNGVEGPLFSMGNTPDANLGITSETTFLNTQGETQHIPCNMINCFCMYSNYQPLTLDEWIACDKNRKQKSCQNVK